MWIQSCIIENFSKFDLARFDFVDGFQVLYGPNESGKTSILDAIYLAFYGFKGLKKDARENPRLRYLTSNSNARVQVNFEEKGKDYRLERIFGRTNGQDEVRLIEIIGQREVDWSAYESPGDLVFGMDGASFVRTVYITSLGTEFSLLNSGDQILDRLGNLESSGHEEYSYQNLYENLEEKKLRLQSKSGKKGRLVDLEDQLDEKRWKLSQALQKEEERVLLEERIKGLKAQQASLEAEEAQAQKAMEEAQNEISERPMQKDLDQTSKQEDLGRGLLFLLLALVCLGLFVVFRENQLLAILFILAGIISIFLSFLSIVKWMRSGDGLASGDCGSSKRFTGEALALKHGQDKGAYDLAAEKRMKNFEDLQKVRVSLAEEETRLKERFLQEETASYLEVQVHDLEESYENLKRDYQALQLAQEALNEVHEKRESHFLPRLRQKSQEILEELIPDQKYQILLDEKLNPLLENKKKESLSQDFLSSGTRDQLYLALRLAIYSLTSDGKSPIFLDDSFVYYDDERAAAAFFFLERLSIQEGIQILFFTSQSKFLPWAKASEDIGIQYLG